MSRVTAAVVVLAAAAVAIACGGQRLSADELRTRAGAICAKAESDLVGVPRVESDDPAATRAALTKTTAITRRAVSELEALKPPDELVRRYDELVNALRQQQKLAEEIAKGLAAGDPDPDPEAIRQGRELAMRSTTISRELGIPSCAAPA